MFHTRRKQRVPVKSTMGNDRVAYAHGRARVRARVRKGKKKKQQVSGKRERPNISINEVQAAIPAFDRFS